MNCLGLCFSACEDFEYFGLYVQGMSPLKYLEVADPQSEVLRCLGVIVTGCEVTEIFVFLCLRL